MLRHCRLYRSARKQRIESSVSCEKLRGFFCNSYNVMETKGKKIESRPKIVGGDFVDLGEIVKRREILQESDISQYDDSLAR